MGRKLFPGTGKSGRSGRSRGRGVAPLWTEIGLGGDGCGGGNRFDQLGDALGELCALADPVVDAVALEIEGSGVGAGIVGAYNLDRTAIAGLAASQ